jgi:hypothetical protein
LFYSLKIYTKTNIHLRLSDYGEYSPRLRLGKYLSFIDPERGGFGVIFPEVMIFSEGLCPEENIITEGNSPNPPSGGSINDILYRKLKNSLSSE